MSQLHEGTGGNMGEAEGKINNNSSTPTLKEFIAQQNISNDVDIYAKLSEMQIDWNTLLHIEASDLEILAKDEMHLPFKVKIKFKSAIKLMQAAYKPNDEQIITITMKETEELNKIKAAMKQNENVSKLLKKHKDQIEPRAKSMRLQIDNAFDAIFNRLQSQKQSLYNKVQEWEQNKLESIEKEILNSVVSKSAFVETKKKCNDLLRNSTNNKERERKMRQMISSIFSDDEECKKYAESASVIDYIKKETRLIDIEFNKDIFANMDEFGVIQIDAKNELVHIPSIYVNEPTAKDADNDDSFSDIHLKWQISHALPQNEAAFEVKYLEEEDEKQSNDIKWNIANIKEMQRAQNGTHFDANLANKYMFDKQYKFKVTLDILEPIALQITSNIVEFMRDAPAPKGPAVKIELKVHSHRKHRSTYVPDNLLRDDDSGYGSAWNNDFAANESDWIMFKLKQENALYLPTKCMVRNGGTTQDVKKMKLWIGDGANEWFAFNVIDVKRTKEKQQFELNVFDWKRIKHHSLQFVKVELIENHGENNPNCCKFVFYQFELYGQKL